MFRGLTWAVVSHSDRGVPRNGNHYTLKTREAVRNALEGLRGAQRCPRHRKHQLQLPVAPLCAGRAPLPGSALTDSWVKNTHGQITHFSLSRFCTSLKDFKVMCVIFTVTILSRVLFNVETIISKLCTLSLIVNTMALLVLV